MEGEKHVPFVGHKKGNKGTVMDRSSTYQTAHEQLNNIAVRRSRSVYDLAIMKGSHNISQCKE